MVLPLIHMGTNAWAPPLGRTALTLVCQEGASCTSDGLITGDEQSLTDGPLRAYWLMQVLTWLHSWSPLVSFIWMSSWLLTRRKALQDCHTPQRGVCLLKDHLPMTVTFELWCPWPTGPWFQPPAQLHMHMQLGVQRPTWIFPLLVHPYLPVQVQSPYMHWSYASIF